MNQLNYEPIKKTANRDFLRENFTRGAEEIYNIPFKKLEFRDGFNKRRIYNNIEHLAGLFTAKGISPLRVDVLPDGRVLIERGHRSYKAIELMIKQGEAIETVPCYINGKDVTEQQRMEAVYTSNMGGEKLHAVEQSDVIYSLKHNFGDNPSNEELGKRLGISRQQVDNLLLLAEADDATKQEMLNGDLGIVEAISYLRNQKKAKKQSEKTEEDSHKTTLSPTPEPKDPLATDLKELAELENEPRTSDYNPEDALQNGERELDLVGNKLPPKEKQETDGEVKYDLDREELKQITNCIKNFDKIEAIVNKLDCPEQTKKDIANLVEWTQRDLAEVRTWIHKNKKQNKIR